MILAWTALNNEVKIPSRNTALFFANVENSEVALYIKTQLNTNDILAILMNVTRVHFAYHVSSIFWSLRSDLEIETV